MGTEDAPAKRPNVVFLFTDDQRFDTIAALGNDQIRTPNLDRLVREGTSFIRAHIPSGTVGAICQPSRAMLHTGRTLFHLGGNGADIPAHHVLLGETLQRAGYDAFGTGKWHNGPATYARSFTAGGEVMFGGMADHWNVPMCDWDPTGRYEVSQPHIETPKKYNRIEYREVDHIHFGKHSTDIVCDHTAQYIRNHTGPKPFFTYTSFLAPHDPRSMPREYLEMYDPRTVNLPENYLPEHPFDYGQTQIRDELLEQYPRPEDQVRRHIAEYYAMITHLDAGVGRIMKALRDTGEYENTIFVFAGDNGLACGQHGLMGKQNHYEHSIRIPLIFAGPGIPRNETRTTYVYLLDIYPTLCELLGIDVPASVEGLSMVPALTESTPVRESLYFAYADLIRSAKDSRYKLALYSNGTRNYAQLFDLEDDPGELENLLAGDTHTAPHVERLFEMVLRYRDEWDDRESPWGRRFWDRFERNGGLEAALTTMANDSNTAGGAKV
jgi:arylsulfatase A-like enzyme